MAETRRERVFLVLVLLLTEPGERHRKEVVVGLLRKGRHAPFDTVAVAVSIVAALPRLDASERGRAAFNVASASRKLCVGIEIMARVARSACAQEEREKRERPVMSSIRKLIKSNASKNKKTNRTLTLSQPPLPSRIRKSPPPPERKQTREAEWASARPFPRTRATLSAVSLREQRERKRKGKAGRRRGEEEWHGGGRGGFRPNLFFLF